MTAAPKVPEAIEPTNNIPATTGTGRSAQADEEFNIRFVNLVREHKCIYDKNLPEYRNKDFQEQSWLLIAKQLNDSAIHCKERWRNLRACLSRYIKQQSGAEPQHKPYYLASHMSFLLPYLRSTRNSTENNAVANGNSSARYLSSPTTAQCNGNVEPNLNALHQYVHKFEMRSPTGQDDEETVDAFDAEATARLEQRHDGIESRTLADTPHCNNTAYNLSLGNMQKFVPNVQLTEPAGDSVVYIPHAQRNSEPNCADFSSTKRFRSSYESQPPTTTAPALPESYYPLTRNEGADMDFFRSILPDIAGFTPRQKRKFKIGILQLIDTIVEPNYAPTQCNGLHAIGSQTQQQVLRNGAPKTWRN